MKRKELLGMIVGIFGLVVLVYSGSLLIALGVFLCLFGNNLERTARR